MQTNGALARSTHDHSEERNVMKFKTLVMPCAVAALAFSLGGCVSYGQTSMLVTPIGVAGIHKFAPPDKSPDNMREMERTAERIAKAAD